jgi:hypothetical protein
VDWERFDLEELASEIRSSRPPADAERTIWAFEQVLAAARLDSELVGYLCVAAVSLLATESDTAPRDVLEQLFRRSISNQEWRERFLPLLRGNSG